MDVYTPEHCKTEVCTDLVFPLPDERLFLQLDESMSLVEGQCGKNVSAGLFSFIM